MRAAGLVLLLSAIACVVLGCGAEGQSPAARRLQREDLIAVSAALKDAAGPVANEVAAAKAAWPLIADGLPAASTPSLRAPIAAAATGAASIRMPAVMREAQAVSLTGPAAEIAGLFGSYVQLATRGWKLIGAALDESGHGSPARGRFARENVALYIESVYDGHFKLAQIGKKLLAGYRRLGGSEAFGAALAKRDVAALARAYSEAKDRLHPHVGVRLGS